MSIKRFALVLSVAFLVAGILHAPALGAQDLGVRIGVSVDPDQFYFGGHVDSGPVYEELRFRPNVEIGFGDNATVVGLNGEFVWPFQLDNGDDLYAGLGPAINIVSFDNGVINDTEVRAGLNFLIGYEFEEGFFAELKVGAIDSPDVKFGFGYTWRN